MSVLDDVPKRLKIGPHIWKVELTDQIDGDEGECDTATLTIKVNPRNDTPSYIVCTLVHELYHAIWYQAGLGKRPKEENVVVAFENGFIGLLRDNPKLLKFLSKHIGDTTET